MAVYFEDLIVGQVSRFGSYAVSRAEALDFARAYDPQPFHLDDEAAAANPIFGRLATSGWHTAAMMMRMNVEEWQRTGFASVGGAGLDELRWVKPVYPGDTLRVEAQVLELRASNSRPDIGFAKVRSIVFNQADEPVMVQVADLIVGRRPA